MAQTMDYIRDRFNFKDMLTQMVTQAYPFHHKIDPFKLKRASTSMLSPVQLTIDFGSEFEVPIDKIINRVMFEKTIVTCVLCHRERELFDRLPFEYDGMKIILSPYSDVYGEVCLECFDKHDGWEIIKLADRRQIIREEIEASRTVLGNRYVLIEKIGHIIQDVETGAGNGPMGYQKKFVSPGIFANVE